MEILKLKPFEAPSRYIFKDPDTGHLYEAANADRLSKRIINYRNQNRLPAIEHLPTILEHYWCNLPENMGKCKPVALKRGFFQTVRGGIVLLQARFFGEKKMVDGVTAEARAQICAYVNGGKPCPKNVFPDKGPFVKWADEMAEEMTGGKKCLSHDKLGNCEVCSCNLRAKVWLKPPFGTPQAEKDQMPDFCWAKKEE